MLRKKYRLASVGGAVYDEYEDDVLNFKDSDRESIDSYLDDDEAKNEFATKTKSKVYKNLIDTPTRLVNHSNEFLPKHKRLNPDKLAQRTKNYDDPKDIKNFADLEQISDVDASQKSSQRKAEQDKKDMLFKIVSS